MFESLWGSCDAAVFHGECDCAGIAIPLEIDSTAVVSFPVFCHNTLFGKMVAHVDCIFLVNALDSKIIDCEAENDGIGFMAEKSWSGGGWVVASFC